MNYKRTHLNPLNFVEQHDLQLVVNQDFLDSLQLAIVAIVPFQQF